MCFCSTVKPGLKGTIVHGKQNADLLPSIFIRSHFVYNKLGQGRFYMAHQTFDEPYSRSQSNKNSSTSDFMLLLTRIGGSITVLFIGIFPLQIFHHDILFLHELVTMKCP